LDGFEKAWDRLGIGLDKLVWVWIDLDGLGLV
jgi:hypothetical protein